MRAHQLEYDRILCGASPKPGTGCLGVFGGWGVREGERESLGYDHL